MTKALGAEIRERRSAPPKRTQEQLGSDAGYKSGAGVSISRIEAGEMKPSPTRLAGIALALGTTPEELEAAARHRTSTSRGALERHQDKRSVKQRIEDLQSAVQRRATATERIVKEYNFQHDRARDDFFMPFVAEASYIDGAPTPPDAPTLDEDAAAGTTGEQARERLNFASDLLASKLGGTLAGGAAGAAAGGALAYGTFTTMAAFGTASTGAAISGLTGVAATNATMAALGGGALAAGGAGMAGGALVLAGIVAAPVALLAAGGFLWARRRSKKQEQAQLEGLEQAESELRYSERGYAAMIATIEEAASILKHIAIFGGRKVQLWRQLPPARIIRWEDLSPERRSDYEKLLQVAASQLTITSIDVGAFLTLKGRDLSDHIERTSETLAVARAEVERYV